MSSYHSQKNCRLVFKTLLELLQLVGNLCGQISTNLLFKILANRLHLSLPKLAGNVKELIKVDVLKAIEKEGLALWNQTDGRFLNLENRKYMLV